MATNNTITSPAGREFTIARYGSRWDLIATETAAYRYSAVAYHEMADYAFTTRAAAVRYVEHLADREPRWESRIAAAHARVAAGRN